MTTILAFLLALAWGQNDTTTHFMAILKSGRIPVPMLANISDRHGFQVFAKAKSGSPAGYLITVRYEDTSARRKQIKYVEQPKGIHEKQYAMAFFETESTEPVVTSVEVVDVPEGAQEDQ